MINDKELIRIISEEEEGTTLDYKEELRISTEGEKANFVKDIVSLANSGETSRIIIGIEDGTRKPLGIKSSHKLETLNQILKDKTDPPIRIDYRERITLGCLVGVIEIDGNNAPYVISVPDRFGGICRGTIYVRNMNINEGAVRADIDRIYGRMKPITLESDVHMSSEVSAKSVGNSIEVDINFFLHNIGDALATDTIVRIDFRNIKEIVTCHDNWTNDTELNEGSPCISLGSVGGRPLVKGLKYQAHGCVVRVEKEIEAIIADVIIGASNMRTRTGEYTIYIKDKSKSDVF